jgi:hypothetical protein
VVVLLRVLQQGLRHDRPRLVKIPITEGDPGVIVQALTLVTAPEDLRALVGGDLDSAETDRLPSLALGHVVVPVPLPGMLEVLAPETKPLSELVQLLIWAIVEQV